MGLFAGTIWIILGIIVLSFGWKLWSNRKFLVRRYREIKMMLEIQKGLKAAMSEPKLQKVKGSSSANSRD